MLIVYYSVSNGNTRRIAEQLQRETGADIAEIETVKPYTGSYQEIVDQGQEEVNSGYQPEIKPLNIDPEAYDVVAVGTPTWWYTMAPAVLTFLTSHDWNGKTVIPFQTYGGWPGHVIKDMRAALLSVPYVPHQEEKSVRKVLKDDFYLPIRTCRLKWESAISPALSNYTLLLEEFADILPDEPVGQLLILLK